MSVGCNPATPKFFIKTYFLGLINVIIKPIGQVNRIHQNRLHPNPIFLLDPNNFGIK